MRLHQRSKIFKKHSFSSFWRRMSVAICSWCVWLKTSSCLQTTPAASSDSHAATWGAACCSCSSGLTAAAGRRAERWLKNQSAHTVSLILWIRLLLFKILTTTNLAAVLFADCRATEGRGLESKVPPWQAGCSVHMLGLHHVTPNYLLNSLKASTSCKD